MNSKRFIAFLLSLTMVASALPMSVFAEGEESVTEEITVQEEQQEESIPDQTVQQPDTESEPEAEAADEIDLYKDRSVQVGSFSALITNLRDPEVTHITLVGDVSPETYSDAYDDLLIVENGRNVTLDLNGYSIDLAQNRETGLIVQSNATLTLNNSGVGKSYISHATHHGISVAGTLIAFKVNITENGSESELNGTGVYVSGQGKASLDYCTVCDNNGRGMYIWNSDVELEDVTITGNKTKTMTYDPGAGIYLRGTLKVKGADIIKDNQTGGSSCNVYLEPGSKIKPVDSFYGSNIGITMEEPGVFTTDLGTYGAVYNFFADDTGLYPSVVNGEVTMQSTSSINSWSALRNAILSVDKNPTSFKLSADCIDTEVTEPITIKDGQDITIDLNGHNIDRGFTSYHAPRGNVITNNGTLRIKGTGNITGGLNGRESADYQPSGGLRGGGIINNGTLYLDGGNVTGNKVRSGSPTTGGGIYNKGTLYLNGGSVTNNECITGSSTARVGGGGIYNEESAVLVMNSGTISGNSSRYIERNNDEARDGGGIYNCGTVTVKGGTISDNSAQYGGAIYNDTNATLEITGGTFSGNTVSRNASGGAIYNKSTSFTVSGGSFNGNKARYGGAIYTEAAAVIRGGSFVNNRATVHGGALYVYSGNATVTITGDNNISFNGNTASSDGGAVAVSTGTVTLDGKVSFTGNSASENGGAIAVRSGSASVTVNNGTFSGNTAAYGGAIHNAGNLLLKGGSFTENTASAAGGGIYLAADMNINGKINITGNKYLPANSSTGSENNVDVGTSKIAVDPGITVDDVPALKESTIGVTYSGDTGDNEYVFTTGYYLTGAEDVEIFTSDSINNIIRMTTVSSENELAFHTYQPTYLTSVNLSLSGEVAVNAYFTIADDIDPAASSVTVTGPNGTNTYSLDSLINASNLTSEGYKVSCPVYARQMSEDVSFVFELKDKSGNDQKIYYKGTGEAVPDNTKTTSAFGYAEYVLGEGADGFDEKTKNLVDAMYIYGRIAGVYFSTDPDYSSMSELEGDLNLLSPSRKYNNLYGIDKNTLEPYAKTDGHCMYLGEEYTGIRGEKAIYGRVGYCGLSLIDYSKPKLRLYFTKDMSTVDFEVSYSAPPYQQSVRWGTYDNNTHGEVAYTTGRDHGLYYIEIADISALDWGRPIYVYFCTYCNGGSISEYSYGNNRYATYCIGVSPLSYAYAVLERDYGQGYRAPIDYVAYSLYQYNLRCREYNETN